MSKLVAFFSGLLFSLGLGISGMTKPHVVKGFLDIFGQWDHRLLGVMAGAIGVHAVAYAFIKRRSAPIFGGQFHLPLKKEIDLKLISGAVLFGLGWGWAGICPGPGLVAVVSGKWEFIYFVLSMLVGMKIYQFLESKMK